MIWNIIINTLLMFFVACGLWLPITEAVVDAESAEAIKHYVRLASAVGILLMGVDLADLKETPKIKVVALGGLASPFWPIARFFILK